MPKVEYLIIDTGAFVKDVPLWEYGENLFTTIDVIREVKDKQTKQWIDSLPVQLKFREPSPYSIAFVTDFSKKTGDYSSLSPVDIKVIALTYELEVEKSASSEHLRKEPLQSSTPSVVVYKPQKLSSDNIEGFFFPSKDERKDVESLPDDVSFSSSSNWPLCEDNNIFTWTDFRKYLTQLDEHLVNHSYISGYLATEKDATAIIMIVEFISLQYVDLDDVDLNNLKSSVDLYKTTIDALSRSILSNFSFPETNAKNFCEIIHELPHFYRWFIHVLSFTNDDWLSIKNFGCNQIEQDGSDAMASLNEAGNSVKSIEERTRELSLSDSDEIEQDDDSGCSSDSEEGWITPSNINQYKNKNNYAEEEIPMNLKTGCITVDFAVQNVLKHIGLQVIGVDGRVIKYVRTFILRCYACYRTTSKMHLVFCPHCGYNTLKKVSYTINPDGTRKLYISSRKPIKAKRYSIPLPKGGKHANNPILVADQRIPQQRPTKLGRTKTNVFSDGYEAGFSPFVTRDVYSRSAQLGITSSRMHRASLDHRNAVPKKSRTRRKK